MHYMMVINIMIITMDITSELLLQMPSCCGSQQISVHSSPDQHEVYNYHTNFLIQGFANNLN